MKRSVSGRIVIWLPVLVLVLSGLGAGLHFAGVVQRVAWLKRFYPQKKSAISARAKGKPKRVAQKPPSRRMQPQSAKGEGSVETRDAALRTPGVEIKASFASAPLAREASAAVASAVPSPVEQRLVRVARWMEAMQPEEAAAIAEKMSDAEVERMLSKMRERQAARLLAALKPERAALIARAMTKEK